MRTVSRAEAYPFLAAWYLPSGDRGPAGKVELAKPQGDRTV
jgi:hypothetical protein